MVLKQFFGFLIIYNILIIIISFIGHCSEEVEENRKT